VPVACTLNDSADWRQHQQHNEHAASDQQRSKTKRYYARVMGTSDFESRRFGERRASLTCSGRRSGVPQRVRLSASAGHASSYAGRVDDVPEARSCIPCLPPEGMTCAVTPLSQGPASACGQRPPRGTCVGKAPAAVPRDVCKARASDRERLPGAAYPRYLEARYLEARYVNFQ
jgi:hypothetical protein